MDWLRDLPWQVFWFGWGMVALLALAPLAAAVISLRNTRAIAAQKPVDVADLTEGYRLGWGKTVGPALIAPLTGRPCVWWKVEVWESQRENVPGEATKKRWVWKQILERSSDRVVLFGEGAARAAVDADGAMVVPSLWSDWKGQELPPEERDPDSTRGSLPSGSMGLDVQGSFGPRYRYREQIVEAEAAIFALGRVESMKKVLEARREDAEDDESYEENDPDDDPDQDADSETGPEDLLGMSETPDAVIDQDMRQARWLIARAAGKPFILSTLHPDELAADQDLAVKGGAIMGVVFGALAILAALSRLSG